MRLYLSSYRLGNHVDHLKSLLPSKPRVALVENALDLFSLDSRRAYKTEVYDPFTEMEGLGFTVTELDLRQYFGRPKELGERLSGTDLVWCLGGESFVLRRAMMASGFDTEIVPRLKSGDLVYGGFSAGAVVATPSLRGIHIMDDPETVPEGYPTEVVWNGLNLVDFAIVPHFRSRHLEAEKAERAKSFFEEHQIPHEALVDGDVIVRSGNRVEILRGS